MSIPAPKVDEVLLYKGGKWKNPKKHRREAHLRQKRAGSEKIFENIFQKVFRKTPKFLHLYEGGFFSRSEYTRKNFQKALFFGAKFAQFIREYE